MKKIFVYVAIAALALASACTNPNRPEILPGEGDINLSLQFSAPILTRTAGEGLENAVTSVDYFFYTDVTDNPVYSHRDNSPALSQDTEGNNIYTITLTAGVDGVPDLDVLLDGQKCEFFAVFNCPDAITAAPLATVKATALANSFAHEGPTAGTSTGSKWVVTTDEEANDYPKYFVMTGQQTLTRSGNNAISGTIDMKRVAAKIAVDLKIKKSVTDVSGKVWTPMLGGRQIRLYPQNVAKAAIIGGADATPTFPANLDLFTYKEVILDSELTVPEGQTSKVTDDGTNYVIASQQDFYTFPMTWTRGDDNEPFIKIIVPWSNTTSQKEIYYKVMLPWTSLESNKYYKLTVNVSVLGTEGEPEVTLEPLSAMVVNWQGDSPVNGTISAAKYLSVERGVVTATSSYDTAEGRFDFYTPTSGTDYAASDPVTITIKEIKQKSLTTGNWEYLYQNGTANNAQITARGFTQAQIQNNWFQKVGDNYLQIGHQLNSDLTSTLMDVTPYYYTVVLSLPADIDPSHEYDKTVTFVQWPEVYVVEDPNSNGGVSSGAGMYVNGHQGTNNTYTHGREISTTSQYKYYNDGNYDLGNIRGISDNASNRNGNMYVLTISVSDNYTIGDPRTSEVDQDLIDSFYQASGNYRTSGWTRYYNGKTSNWVSAPTTYGGSAILTYYHSTSSANTETMIAPKIRIASSYGVCSTGRSREEALYRCASYQEDGIPAGRWRLPTAAEVKFIAQLSTLGRIPYLFGSSNADAQGNYTIPVNDDSYYWTANGLIHVNNGTNTCELVSSGSGQSVRCVYDEWFWGDATTTRPVAKGTFTWGDRNY